MEVSFYSYLIKHLTKENMTTEEDCLETKKKLTLTEPMI